MITVFTPTYNRAYIIKKLYESLTGQTLKDFEWLIVDDGSTDNTEDIIKSWIAEGIIPIRYIRQQNRGKHCAINRGVKEAAGELFFIVDSDDYLPKDSIRKVKFYYSTIKGNNAFAGVCGLKFYPNGERVGGEFNFDTFDCSTLDIRFKYKVKGDLAEVFRTDILKDYPFPEIKGEKFCPEAVVWNRIAQRYKLRYFKENIYMCDYLSDGLSAKITKIRMESPMGSMICYSDLSKMNIPFMQKTKAITNFWRFYFCGSEPFPKSCKRISKMGILLLPIGWIMHQKDKHRI